MKNLRRFLLKAVFTGLCICIINGLSAQDKVKSFKDYFAAYNEFSRAYTQEKVYLHFDNTSYFIGENIWFKAYVLYAENHAYSQMSKTLYVELLDSKGAVLISQKLKIENGQCSSGLLLSHDWQADFYEVRAYTRCMLNFGEDVVFSRVFPVMDAISHNKKTGELNPPAMTFSKSDLPIKRIEAAPRAGLSLDFYPEGGHLIEGLPCLVAFKAIGKKGEDAVVSGNLYNSRDEVVALLSSLHQGMGYMEFTPERGQQYLAKVWYEGKEYTFRLPLAKAQAYNLKVNNLPADYLSITVNGKPDQEVDSIGLSLSCRGRIYAQAVLSAQTEQVFQFPKHSMPSGVQQITLLNRQGEILAERLVFVKNPLYDPLEYSISVKQIQETLSAFRPIHLDVQVEYHPDARNSEQPMAHFETPLVVSVRDASENLKNAPLVDAYSQLLLASELKGYIRNPSWYFQKDDLRRRKALDLLMLVQGWKRYDWALVTGDKVFEVKHPIEEGILLQGQIISQILKKPKNDITVTVWMTSDSTAYYGNCLTDSSGAFNFLFDFLDTWQLSLQIKDGEKRKNHRIVLDRLFSPTPKAYDSYENASPRYERLRFSEIASGPLLSLIDSSKISVLPGEILLPQAEIKRKAGNRIDGDEISIIYSVEQELDVIRDKAENEYADIPIFLTQVNPNFWLSERYNKNSDSMKEMLFYKSKEVVFILEDLYTISIGSEEMPYVDEVEKIAIVESVVPKLQYESIEAVATMKDRVYVYLFRYKDRRRNIDPLGIRKTTLQGYSRVKKFFHPTYDQILMSDPEDHRRTLYWNPELKTDSTGKAKLRFYNDATCKKIIVDAMLITAEGKIGLIKPED